MSVPSSELGPPTPSPACGCVSPLGPNGRKQHSLGVRGLNSDDWTESLALHILCSIGGFITETKLPPCGYWYGNRQFILLYAKTEIHWIKDDIEIEKSQKNIDRHARSERIPNVCHLIYTLCDSHYRLPLKSSKKQGAERTIRSSICSQFRRSFRLLDPDS